MTVEEREPLRLMVGGNRRLWALRVPLEHLGEQPDPATDRVEG
jgi:hypothetical protein